MNRSLPLLMLVLVLVACGGEADVTSTTADTSSQSPTTTVGETTTSSQADTTTTVAETTTTAPATTTTAVAEASAACLVGDWVVAGESMQAFYDGLGGEVEGLTITVSGLAHLTFTETTYQWRPDFTIDVEIGGGMGGTGTATGTIDGNYTAVDGLLVTSSEVNALEVVVTVGGITIETDAANQLLNTSPVNDAAFECGPSGPIIHFKTIDSTVPITLDPA